jgi:cell division septation protein DedD
MRSPCRLLVLLAVALSGSLALAAPAHADKAYDKVADAYARAGGHLDPCAFTQAELEAAVRGIPPNIRDVVPALRAAMVEGIAAHKRGDCKGVKPEEGTTGGAAPGTAPSTTTPPVTTPPATTQTAPAVPPATMPTTPTTTPAPAAPQPAAASTAHERDRTPLVIALIALGALVLLALLGWGVARLRGWDPIWTSRMRHAWGEAGFRTTSTWSEFTDWLRLGR